MIAWPIDRMGGWMDKQAAGKVALCVLCEAAPQRERKAFVGYPRAGGYCGYYCHHQRLNGSRARGPPTTVGALGLLLLPLAEKPESRLLAAL